MKRKIFVFMLIPLILLIVVCVINIWRRNVYIYDEYIIYNNTKYVIPTEDEDFLLDVFTSSDEEQLLGYDFFGGHYFKSKMDKDCNIIYYKGFGMCTYIKDGFSIPKLDECYLEQIKIESYSNESKNFEKWTINFSDKLSIYDIATPNNSVNEKDLEYININLDAKFTNVEYLYINCITVFTDGNKYYLSIFGLDNYLELSEEYTYIFNQL